MAWKSILVPLLVFVVVLVRINNAVDQGGQPRRFPHVSERALELLGDAEGDVGDSVALIDVAAFRRNVARVRASLPRNTHPRVVLKSLPSISLALEAAELLKTQRFMAFHSHFLSEFLSHPRVASLATGGALDVLLGVPLGVPAVSRVISTVKLAHPQDWRDIVSAVKWLIPSNFSAAEYLKLSQKLRLPLRTVVEVDVGLRRENVVDQFSLEQALSFIAKHKNSLLFSGFMGYDGHCRAAPLPFLRGGWIEAATTCVQDAMDEMATHVNTSLRLFPQLLEDPSLIFNSGGSATVTLFGSLARRGRVNDLCVGSALLKPTGFDLPSLSDLEPAIFVAGSVVKVRPPWVSTVPFIPYWVWQTLRWLAADLAATVVVGGLPLPGLEVYDPPGLRGNPIMALASGPATNLLPTQHLLHHSPLTKLGVGDVVLYRPHEGDTMLGYDRVFLVGDSPSTNGDSWATFRGGL
jgi:hypothetical protein